MNVKNKEDYLFTSMLSNHLYIEVFSVYKGGVQGGDIHANYLTDSTNFRLFIGTHDDDGIFYYHLEDDSIVVENTLRKAPRKELSRKIYSLSQLKKEKKFE